MISLGDLLFAGPNQKPGVLVLGNSDSDSKTKQQAAKHSNSKQKTHSTQTVRNARASEHIHMRLFFWFLDFLFGLDLRSLIIDT